MAHTFIISTPHSLLRPLAWQGIQAQSAYDQLAHTLHMRLGERQAAYLAEPVSGAETIDWYATAPGIPIKLAELTLPEQTKVRAELQDFAQKAHELSANLKQSSDSNSILAGALLELALSYPSEEYLYALKDGEGNLTPLLVGWGFAPAGIASEPESITAIKAAGVFSSGEMNAEPAQPEDPSAPGTSDTTTGAALFAAPSENTANQTGAQAGQTNPPQDPQETTVIRHVFPFPWALLAFLLAVGIMVFLLFWLLPRVGLPESIGFAGCSREDRAATTPESNFDPAELYRAQGREDALRAELERLRREYEMRLWMCDKQAQTPDPVVPATPEPPVNPEPLPEPDPTPPVPELALPELPPDPPPQPKPKPEPKPAPKPKTQPDVMVIPEDPTNLEFLEGCWYAQTGLRSSRTKMPISVKYCFDGNGNGSITLVERDKSGRQTQECKGGAHATLNGGQLYIRDMGAVCPDGTRYEKEKVTCRNADGSQALCTGVGDPSGTKNWWDKPFTRTDR